MAEQVNVFLTNNVPGEAMELGAGPPGFLQDAQNKCPVCETAGPSPPEQELRDSPSIQPEWLAETHRRQQKSIKSLLTHSLSEPS